ncbi:hypothetical protein [Rhizobium bangladeshense]|uniref:hypothetical protein n=1 Tax=Rhizobium bangladeshense TaxID=1138189 RepID=UPI001C83A8B3|nr:hypothetical protein [Rhizobium bangladeshense]MBX4897450.1 hypothetical protein [Rhizobium bangladeshense]
MQKIREAVPDGNRRRFLSLSGMVAVAAAVPAVPQSAGFVDQTILWLRERFMQEAQRFVSGNGSSNISAERMGRIAHVMAELPAGSDRAIDAKRGVAVWEGEIGGERVSYNVMTKFELAASVRRDEMRVAAG